MSSAWLSANSRSNVSSVWPGVEAASMNLPTRVPLFPEANLGPLVKGKGRVAEATFLDLVAELVDDVPAECPSPNSISQIARACSTF
jgi:hypothetical protein